MATICAPPQKAAAQSYCLEFKAGGAATSTINSSTDKKVLSDTKPGVTVGAGFGLILPNDMFRIYGEAYYTTKGEKYTMGNGNYEFSSDVCYFHLYPNARFYTPYVPVYLGAGLYFGTATSRDVDKGDEYYLSQTPKPKKYYKVFDMGPRAAIGAELGVGTVKLNLEAAYEYGFMNISNRDERKIKNQGVTLTIGLSFQLSNKHYRHY